MRLGDKETQKTSTAATKLITRVDARPLGSRYAESKDETVKLDVGLGSSATAAMVVTVDWVSADLTRELLGVSVAHLPIARMKFPIR
jgi:hypothetical protein